MKVIITIARILLGITFVFSGFVKGIDPLGSMYKFTDYFNAMHLGWASQLSFVLSILLSLSEYAIGIALLFNYRMKFFSWLVLLYMTIFTPITLWVAITNPVSDCGCFGDALVISNWATFYKNIALLLLAVLVFRKRFQIRNHYNIHFQNAYFILFLLLFGWAQMHSYNHLPLIDFRAYKTGNNIPEGMLIPDDAPADEYNTEFIYRNKQSGVEKEFDESNYPWQDTINWEYVDSRSILVKEGYHPPITNFTIENEFGEDVSDFFLLDPAYTFIVVAYNLDDSSTKKQEKLNELAENAKREGMNFICLTASTRDKIEEFKAAYQVPYEFFFCDEITLKTMIRSNPGVLLLQEGTILNKWHWKDLPEFDTVKKQLSSDDE
ncbi:BT_3928 family protein [Roseimarinus sediminis]|uniref:BT_3928 family protein n=1 Tax=Roseimarinus sediminis TaxID=1610899 RepID=UPI003D19CB4D